MLFVAAGCYEDKGSYDYSYSNRVTVEFPPLGQQMLGERVLYTPTVTFDDQAPEGDFEYWWANTGKGINAISQFGDAIEFDTICKTKELNYIPNVDGFNILRFYVREKATGAITERPFTLTVGTPYTRGWMVLSRDASGKSLLSFVRPGSKTVDNVKVREFTPYPNAYAEMFPDDELGTNPELLRVQYALASFGGSVVFVFQEDSPVVLGGNTLGKERPFTDMFAPAAPEGFHPKDFRDALSNPNFSIVLSTDRKIYTRHIGNMYSAGLYSNPYSSTAASNKGEEVTVDLMPESNVFTSKAQLLVDLTAKKAQWYIYNAQPTGMGNTGQIAEAAYSGTAPDFDFRDFGDAEPVFFYGYPQSFNTGRYLVVYKKDGVYKYLFTNAAKGFTAPPPMTMTLQKQGEFPAEYGVSESSVFHYYGTTTQQYMFFGVGNKLYHYEYNTDRFTLFYTLPEGEVIVDMLDNPQRTELVVVTEGGTFVVIGLTDMRAGMLVYETTLPGTIIDLEYKYSDFSAAQGRITDF